MVSLRSLLSFGSEGDIEVGLHHVHARRRGGRRDDDMLVNDARRGVVVLVHGHVPIDVPVMLRPVFVRLLQVLLGMLAVPVTMPVSVACPCRRDTEYQSSHDSS